VKRAENFSKALLGRNESDVCPDFLSKWALRSLALQMMADRFTAAINQAVQERVAELEIPAK
jgi:hypothetical protein